MKFSILTLFPEMFRDFCDVSIMKRSFRSGCAEMELVNIRDFSEDKHHHVDDTPYGGGAGMLMQIGPIDRALRAVRESDSYVLLTSPKAKPLTQNDMRRLSKKQHIIILCGHYEGFDERVSCLVDENVSIGDYILTGGELPAMIIMDSIIRLLDGSIRKESLDSESHDNGLLEYPQYTKPRLYRGLSVPEVLLSGNHRSIAEWREKMALFETLRYRPDLLKNRNLSAKERNYLKEIYREMSKKS